MSEFKVHPKSFDPPRRGRNPLVQVEGIVKAATNADGAWISKTFPESQANSVIRQIRNKYDKNDIEVCSLRDGDDRTVYVRVTN